MPDRRQFVASLTALVAAGRAGALHAQARADLPRVGFLFAANTQAIATRMSAFRSGMAELGYVDGKQVRYETRYANGDLARLPALAGELVRLPCAVIVSGGSSATRPLANATSTIPIVTGQDNDPVAAGFAKSYARPGGNVTGLATLAPELAGKQMALLVELLPGVRHVAIFGDSGEAGNALAVAEAERAAATLQVRTLYVDSRSTDSLARMFATATQAKVGGALVLQSAYMFPRLREISDLALKEKLPAIYANPEFVRQDGLATYGVNVDDLFRRAAGYVVKILNGAHPADLPIEQPRAFDLVINLRTARAIGVTVPQALLLRADEVVK